jgi:hypothetical protein
MFNFVFSTSWSKTRSHLEYLHLQILSIVTGAQLKRIFERRTNFDLRRLLSGKFSPNIYFWAEFSCSTAGAEPFMNSLLNRLESDIAMSMSSLHCLKMEPSLRKRIAETLVPNNKVKVSIVPLSSWTNIKRRKGYALHHPYCKQPCGHPDKTEEAFNTPSW